MTDPGSVIGLAVVDKSTKLLGESSDITEDSVSIWGKKVFIIACVKDVRFCKYYNLYAEWVMFFGHNLYFLILHMFVLPLLQVAYLHEQKRL